ncbi:unnamed protein product [Phytomonas sp. EM1]|nr:unnamed protein product [Phytomonas sp. EM1]|eukprot:CCW61063.1 unnamed protein product [Phytomonas sp. isolate EM1]
MPPSSIALTSQTETNSEGALAPNENSSDSNASQGSSLSRVRQISSRNYEEVLRRLPSSPKELIQRIDRQRNEIRLLQEENLKLKSRELEVSSLTLKLQQQLAATQSQVASLKANIQLQLANPITKEEYNSIEALPEAKRDLLDTVKLGVYRQLGSLQASSQAAVRRAAELGTSVDQLNEENRDLKVQIAELQSTLDFEKKRCSKELIEVGNQRARILELETTVKDMEGRLKGAFLDQEQFLTAKLTAQVKTDEVARLSIQLEEAELDSQRYKANAECSEQKLDILKSEYYELKLHYRQRILELESALQAANEKLKALGDLEMESELFISNLAAGIPEPGVGASVGSPFLVPPCGEGEVTKEGVGGGVDPSMWIALPPSRKLSHALTVTRRCLRLENDLVALRHDVAAKDRQLTSLRNALEAARAALNNSGSPYTLLEKRVEGLAEENDRLRERLERGERERAELTERLRRRTQEVERLAAHREDLRRMKALLAKITTPGAENTENVKNVINVKSVGIAKNAEDRKGGAGATVAAAPARAFSVEEVAASGSAACPDAFGAIHITS